MSDGKEFQMGIIHGNIGAQMSLSSCRGPLKWKTGGGLEHDRLLRYSMQT